MFHPMPKIHPFRSKKLRDLAREVPVCMSCGVVNDDNVVLAHSNRLEDGKGMGVKAHDVPCYVCDVCHNIIDGRIPGYTLQEREELRLEATYKSVVWCLLNGHLPVK